MRNCHHIFDKTFLWLKCKSCKQEFRSTCCSICSVWGDTKEVFDQWIEHQATHYPHPFFHRTRFNYTRSRNEGAPKPSPVNAVAMKIAKLSTMTVARGATPAEEENAKNLIRKLKEKGGLM